MAIKPKKVPINKPEAAPVAIERLPTDPVPFANTNGIIPKIKANEVIKIGRNLALAALMADMAIDSP